MNISPKYFRDKLLAGEHLPSGLVVKGYLDLGVCTSLTHLPSGLVVKGDLYLYGCTSLTHLPAGLVVKGYLDLKRCTSLTHLPAGLVVEGTVYCNKELIDKIPREDLPLYLNFNFEEEIHKNVISRLKG